MLNEWWFWVGLYAVGTLIAAFVIAYFFGEHMASMSMFWPFLIPIGAVVGGLMYAAHLGAVARRRFPLKSVEPGDNGQ